MDEVRRAWVIKRLRDYKRQKEQLGVLQATIHDLLSEISGLKSPAMSDMPHGSETSDRTYQQYLQLPDIYKQIEQIELEIEGAKAEIKLIDDAVGELNPTECFVIQHRYLKPVVKNQYRILARENCFAESTLKNAHTSALKKLVEIL